MRFVVVIDAVGNHHRPVDGAMLTEVGGLPAVTWDVQGADGGVERQFLMLAQVRGLIEVVPAPANGHVPHLTEVPR